MQEEFEATGRSMQFAAILNNNKILRFPPGQGNLVNKNVIIRIVFESRYATLFKFSVLFFKTIWKVTLTIFTSQFLHTQPQCAST